MKTIKISKNWFFSAGTKYGWIKDNLDGRGVGVRMSDLKDHKSIEIQINGERYLLESEKAVGFIEKYKSIFIAGASTQIGVISRSLLRQIGSSSSPEKQEEAPADQQQNDEENFRPEEASE